MKPLKKHPKQQRMEDITFPLHKEKVILRFGKCFYHPGEPAVLQSGTAEYNLCQKCLDESRSKVVWEGREWLRSISDPHHERHVAVVILLVASIIYCVAILL